MYLFYFETVHSAFIFKKQIKFFGEDRPLDTPVIFQFFSLLDKILKKLFKVCTILTVLSVSKTSQRVQANCTTKQQKCPNGVN